MLGTAFGAPLPCQRCGLTGEKGGTARDLPSPRLASENAGGEGEGKNGTKPHGERNAHLDVRGPHLAGSTAGFRRKWVCGAGGGAQAT